MTNVFFPMVSLLFIIQMLLNLFMVEGKAEFLDKKLKRRYAWMQTGLTALLLIPTLLMFYLLPQQSALPAAVAMVGVIYVTNAVVEFKYVRGTKEHRVSLVMTAIYLILAVMMSIFGWNDSI
ncbi:DUF4181 domain-containing protein [Saccharibacillus sp. JS10]|uniref:DUF4181 domain-containing protein n=1 Tax=Saccharibacillus sp. JS10 TaxID=2950552 RepID=UPI00210BC3B7|nr:DUF4181 domain-containing protein [Saccharibacillus sp. JS10]MCQ4086567.1 DUF4181 domain-containing protein [Saccharibacillus sp. JS10]